ncbi:MAG: tRNA 2-thiouridine(34) synthase MnmA [Bacilli bacterium]|nr:tRNA 2-thiouridine(34) synthase MnmA [Bacilli bacterium]MDY6430204.1 tRNA 2-thiouridine(34) synthase MnmA [Bacilli bacterium]
MKVMIGLSGGVDSAVAAYLLKQQGYEVIAGFMRNWDALTNNDYLGNPTILDNQCPQEKDYDDAKKVAEKLGIPLLRIDFVKEYWDHVFSYFLEEYKRGRTPNPDVFCNKYIKFDSFLKFAKDNGCEMIAMGHYADKAFYNGHYHLIKAVDLTKDQSYFLGQINEDQIKSCLFPLGKITKTEVRKIAHELDLESVMDKKDSTGICFIGERNFKLFLQNYFPAQKGNIIDGDTGKVIGQHSGVLYYTIGQHKGMGIGGIKGREEGSYFIYKKDVKKNELYVTSSRNKYLLMSDECVLTNINWIGEKLQDLTDVGVKFRYRQQDQACKIIFEEQIIRLIYEQGVEAVTPGQIAVIYQGDVLLGSGIIDSIYRAGEKIN